MPVLCLLSLISRNSSKQLGMVSPELHSGPRKEELYSDLGFFNDRLTGHEATTYVNAALHGVRILLPKVLGPVTSRSFYHHS